MSLTCPAAPSGLNFARPRPTRFRLQRLKRCRLHIALNRTPRGERDDPLFRIQIGHGQSMPGIAGVVHVSIAGGRMTAPPHDRLFAADCGTMLIGRAGALWR